MLLLAMDITKKKKRKLYKVEFFLKRSFRGCHLSNIDNIVFAQRLRARWVKQALFLEENSIFLTVSSK